LSKFTPWGRNSGSITEAMNSTVISGTARTSSMKPTQSMRTTGISERRPSARSTPIGSEATIPTPEMTRVRNSPPQSEVRTTGRPNAPPWNRKNAITG
jgi:hypothetical protein